MVLSLVVRGPQLHGHVYNYAHPLCPKKYSFITRRIRWVIYDIMGGDEFDRDFFENLFETNLKIRK